MKISREALIIFARKPVLGTVKTRLAASIGDKKALQVYLKLLKHTRQIAEELLCDKFAFLSETVDDDFWGNFYYEQQLGETLGEKMENAFKIIFDKGYKKCIIVGSDCPDLTSKIVDDAFKELSKKDIVIGPAMDGGYYLLGMNNLITPLFHKKEWSTNVVFNQTINDIEKLRLTYQIIPTLSDVDEVQDIPKAWLLELNL